MHNIYLKHISSILKVHKLYKWLENAILNNIVVISLNNYKWIKLSKFQPNEFVHISGHRSNRYPY
jgi:hypothetical protein